MTNIIPLSNHVKSTAENLLSAYIDRAKNEITAFGSNLNFDNDLWDITEFYAKSEYQDRNNGGFVLHFRHTKKNGASQLLKGLSEFAKAFTRIEYSNRSRSSMTNILRAMRSLDKAMRDLKIESVAHCDASTFNRASELLHNSSETGPDRSVGSMLSKIARFMDEKGFVYAPLHNWRFATNDRNYGGRVGADFERRRKQKLPEAGVLEAVAHAFHLAKEGRDILVTSVLAIMCGAPQRINEVLALRENCEIEQTGDDGKKYLGLRWVGSKGAPSHIKWILPGMADVVREALARIRRVTAGARAMARWYEENPARLYLTPEFEYLRDKEILTLDDVGSILGFGGGIKSVRSWIKENDIPLSYIPFKHPIRGWIEVQAIRFDVIERHILSELPIGFPIYYSDQEIRYSELLFVFPRGLFGNRSSTSGNPCMFESLKYHHISCSLGKNAKSQSVSIFKRLSIDSEIPFKARSHQFRHWLNTLAQGENISQFDIAKWSGRTSIHQNAAYDHVSSEEIVSKIRDAIGDRKRIIGPLVDIPKNLPVTRDEYAAMVVPTAHVTPYGFCIHDFTFSPCEKFRKCLDCREHVCIKGMTDKTARIEHALDTARNSLSKAQRAAAEEVYGADDWVEVHETTVKRLEELTTILRDPSVNEGAVVQLRLTNSCTITEQAAMNRNRNDESNRKALPKRKGRKTLK